MPPVLKLLEEYKFLEAMSGIVTSLWRGNRKGKHALIHPRREGVLIHLGERFSSLDSDVKQMKKAKLVRATHKTEWILLLRLVDASTPVAPSLSGHSNSSIRVFGILRESCSRHHPIRGG